LDAGTPATSDFEANPAPAIGIGIAIPKRPGIGTAIIDRTPSAPDVPWSFHCNVSSDSPR